VNRLWQRKLRKRKLRRKKSQRRKSRKRNKFELLKKAQTANEKESFPATAKLSFFNAPPFDPILHSDPKSPQQHCLRALILKYNVHRLAHKNCIPGDLNSNLSDFK